MFGIDPGIARTAWARALVYAVVVVLFCAIWIVRKTLLVFATALMLAYLLYPFVEGVDRRLSRKNRALAVAVPFTAIFGLVAVFIMLISAPLRGEYDHLKRQITEKGFQQELREWQPLGLPIGEHIAESIDPKEVIGMMPELSRIVRTTARYLLNLVIIPILSFLILKDGRAIRDSALELFGSRGQAEGVLMDAHALLLEYMRALLLLCLATLIAFTSVLTLMRVPYPVLLALAAFALEFVPLIGPLTAGALIVGVCAFNHYTHVPGVILFLIVYRLFQDYVLSPRLMEKGVKLHPLLVLFGVFAGGEIGNIPGIFLSIPLLAILRLVFFEWRKRTPASNAAAA
jgi:predicted PurR-regulated permease PerM